MSLILNNITTAPHKTIVHARSCCKIRSSYKSIHTHSRCTTSLHTTYQHRRVNFKTKSLPSNDETSEQEQPQKDIITTTDNDNNILPVSIVFYSIMTGASILIGKDYHILDQLTNQPLLFQPTLISLGAMSFLFVTSTVLADLNFPSFKALKETYQKVLIPQLKRVPVYGLAIMALGAGIGEETAFRALLQTWCIDQIHTLLSNTNLSINSIETLSNISIVLGISVTSVVFGVAHALNKAYFIFALAASVVFGIEYIVGGLPAVACTHAVYDFIAFIAIIQMWDLEKERNVN